METAFEEPSGANSVAVNRLWYQFPIGSNFTATVGGLVRQDDMLAVWPSAYPTDTVLDFFTYAGAPGAYNLTLGAGAGLSWESDDFSISANYISANAANSRPGTSLYPGINDQGTNNVLDDILLIAVSLVVLPLIVLLVTAPFRLLMLLKTGVLQRLTTTPLPITV